MPLSRNERCANIQRTLSSAVLLPLFAVVVDVGPERRRDAAARLDPLQQVGIDQRAVLDSVTAVRVRPFLKDSFVGLQHHVDRHVAVGVHANLKIVPMRVLDRLVDLLLCHRQNAVVVRADVRRAHAHGPL